MMWFFRELWQSGFVTIILIVGLVIGLVCWATKPPTCASGAKVVSVGGCDRNGFCGVLMDDGRKGTMTYPVIGQVCP